MAKDSVNNYALKCFVLLHDHAVYSISLEFLNLVTANRYGISYFIETPVCQSGNWSVQSSTRASSTASDTIL